ncbi:metal-dependent hydrolase [Altererythrobacter sp.]|uniref:metal-dependent hydrolase n=1 Tax=Altererythrobacter sp. TaxID=1872480 RepID=UPI003D00ED1B
MPTVVTHAAVPLAIAVAAGPQRISRHVAMMGVVLAMLPDADVIGFRIGIQYADTWGHRGATHSLVVALLAAAVIAAFWRPARATGVFLFLFFAAASHGLLDAFTDGGLGIALLWPFGDARYFAPVTPIRVSPIGSGFFSARGFETLLSELRWIWLPSLALAIGGRATMRRLD